MSRVLLGVTGGIAAYKACELLRRLRADGTTSRSCPPPLRWSSSAPRPGRRCPGHPVHTSVFDDAHQVPHVQLGQEADLVLVAPATADLLARAADGRADDLLTNVLLTARCPVLFAPAMHTEMWLHPATQANVDLAPRPRRRRHRSRLRPADRRRFRPRAAAGSGRAVRGRGHGPRRSGRRRRGGPARSRRAPSRSAPAGPGSISTRSGSWATPRRAGWAGPWPAPRCCAAPSAPRRGQRRVARPAGRRGRDGHLDGRSGRRHDQRGQDADLVVMAAAPADFTPAKASRPRSRSPATPASAVDLVQTTDVLAGLVAARTDARQVIVGFAAETPAADQSLLELGGPSWPARAAICWCSTMSATAWCSAARQRDRLAHRRRSPSGRSRAARTPGSPNLGRGARAGSRR